MEAASIRPDNEFRDDDQSTAPWHFIDICLQDRRADIPARCPGGNCVTGKIDEYSKRLKDGNYDRWGAAGDLAFLIHFVGDIHQPLHAANDADRGGNCIPVDPEPREKIFTTSGTPLSFGVSNTSIDSGRPETTAHKLEKTYAARKRPTRGFRPPTISRGNRIKLRVPTSMPRCIFQSTLASRLNACLNPAGRQSNWTQLIWISRGDRGPSARESGIQAGEPAE